MTGNPYHDASGKFCAKDTAIESYENEIADALENDEFQRYSRLKRDYENMMIDADPQSDVAQKALQRDYGTLNKSFKKIDREEKKREKTIMKSNENTLRYIDRFNHEARKYAKKHNLSPSDVADEWAANRKMDQDPIGLIHPDYIVKPKGKYKEIPQSEVQEGDIVSAVGNFGVMNKLNLTRRIASFNGSESIEFYDPSTESRSIFVSRDIDNLRNNQHEKDSFLIITSVVRDEGAEEFLKEHKKREDFKREKEKQIKELEQKKRELEKEIYETRGY